MQRKTDLLTTGQAAKLCSVTPDTILKWVKKGWLKGGRTAGGHYRLERGELESFVRVSRPPESLPPQVSDHQPRSLRCWEYLSDRGTVKQDCEKCVVYRVRAARCFLMAGLEPDVGHARRFCKSSCEECVYYRRVNGLATNVLFITTDDELVKRLSVERDESVSLCFARNAYEASAIIPDLRPAFVAIDTERIPAGDTELLDCLAADPRVPGLKIILVVPQGLSGDEQDRLKSDLVVNVLKKPFGTRRIAAVISSFPVDFLTPEDSPP